MEALPVGLAARAAQAADLAVMVVGQFVQGVVGRGGRRRPAGAGRLGQVVQGPAQQIQAPAVVRRRAWGRGQVGACGGPTAVYSAVAEQPLRRRSQERGP
ncbi:hypothetical protein ACFV1C_38665 [Streptomyces sp. NPDC059605]|uniref:hypothetical protein n=1 Tax=unclassified Streptomyces TaxID=2593676 RepID=UPI0036A56138